jgi:hypothetical protein
MFLQCFALERKIFANKDNFLRHFPGSLLKIKVHLHPDTNQTTKNSTCPSGSTEATDPSTTPSNEKELLLIESARKLE